MPITNNDPLLGQEVQVVVVESGGFMVRQLPGFAGGNSSQLIDTFCVNMDAVSDLLNEIYGAPGP